MRKIHKENMREVKEKGGGGLWNLLVVVLVAATTALAAAVVGCGGRNRSLSGGYIWF